MSLLFYDRVNGVGAFYSVDANGNMSLIREDDGWRKTWWQIVPTGFYTPEHPSPSEQLHLSLLFYDDVAGEGELYTLDAQGNMGLLKTNTGWRHNWTFIIPGEWVPPQTGLLFYDATAGEGAFY